MNADIRKRFFENRDETGRMVVTSFKTGISYFIEPMGFPRTDWGSYNPSTGNVENKKGWDKYTGSIDPKDSMITEQNGFSNIIELGVGVSPLGYISQIDDLRYEQGRRPKQ